MLQHLLLVLFKITDVAFNIVDSTDNTITVSESLANLTRRSIICKNANNVALRITEANFTDSSGALLDVVVHNCVTGNVNSNDGRCCESSSFVHKYHSLVVCFRI